MNRDVTSCKTIIVVHQIVWFQKISIPPTPPAMEDHWKFQGGGVSKAINISEG